ncbi:MAG TPA: EpsG family protein [bacterium]|nr:EpsG family protein [bacterium]
MHVYYLTLVFVFVTAFLAQDTRSNPISVAEHAPSANPLQNIKASSMFVFLAFLALFLVAGLRWKVGTDYQQYSQLYWSYSRVPLNELLSLRISNLGLFGIRAISIISRYLYDDPASMFLLASLITIGLSVRHISKSSSMFLFSIMLFIFGGSWHGSFNGMRQSLATAVIFAGSGFMMRREFWKYLLVVLAAVLFHSSAFVMLPIYFIAGRKIDYRQWAMLIAITVFMISSYDVLFKISEILLDKEVAATLPYMTRRVNSLRVAASWAPILLYFMVRKVYGKDAESNFYMNMLIITAMLKVGTMNSAYLMRVTGYTGVFMPLALPKILACFEKRSALLLKLFILGLYAIFWYVEISKTPELRNFRFIFAR